MVPVNTPVGEHSGACSVEEALLSLLHAAWLRWLRVRRVVYGFLNVGNTEELIQEVMDVKECRVREGMLARLYEALVRAVPKDQVEEARRHLEGLAREGVWVTPFYSRCYPCELLRYPAHGDYLYPPLMLYWLGRVDPNERPAVAVVGTRRCSSEGRRLAREIGKMAARHELILVTGLAECIDSEAARGALEEGGTVIGVRPWLKPLSVPREAKPLLRSLGDGLAIVSENPLRPSGNVNRLFFLRNRVIAGMAKLVIVVEAMPGGGSMHQVELALKRGKPVAVYEPSPDTPYYEAYMQYCRRGAKSFKALEELEEIIRATVTE